MGRLPGLGQGCRPVGGVCMQAALVTVSELVRAGLGRWVLGKRLVGGRWAGCLPWRGTACGQAARLGWRWRPVGGAALGKLHWWLLAGTSWAGQVGWSAQLDSSPTPPQKSHPFPGVDWQKQATEECENEGSDFFRNYWIYEAMFRCSVLARSDAVRSKDCFL